MVNIGIDKGNDDIELGMIDSSYPKSRRDSAITSSSSSSLTPSSKHAPPSEGFRPKSRYKQSWLGVFAEVFLNLGIEIGFVFFIFRNYGALYQIAPIGVSAMTSSALSGLSQGLSQAFGILSSNRLLPEMRSFNYTTIIKFYVWGVFNGIFSKLWFDLLFNDIPYLPLRVILDQSIGNPVNIVLYLIFSSLWESSHNNHMLAVKVNFWKVLKASWVIWPIFSVLAFCFISNDVIVPVSCLLNLVWSIVLGRVSN